MRFVDPKNGSRAPLAQPGELDLIRQAEAYANMQAQKSVKWFVCHGVPLPSDSETTDLTRRREEDAAAVARALREADCQRVAGAEGEDIAVVPLSKHPLYGNQEAVKRESQASFAEAAGNGLVGRRTVFSSFEQLCRIVLLRNRVDNRLQRLAKKAARAAANTDVSASMEIPKLVLVEMPLLRQSGSSSGTSVSATKDAPTAPEVKLFAKKELKIPFEFKNKCYRQLRFSEHPFANADLPDAVPVLYAGVGEVPPDPAEAPVPKIDHFVQPIVTLETYPLPPFAYVTPKPWQRTIQSQLPQQLSDGGFAPPHHLSGFGRLGASSVTHSDPTTRRVMRRPLPTLLHQARDEDAMSDSDEDEPLPQVLPSGLDEIRSWLPAPEARVVDHPEFRHTAGNDVCQSRRQSLHGVAGRLKDDLPKEYHLLL